MRPIDADALKEFIDDCEICNICPQKAPRCSYDCDFPECVTEKWNVAIDAQPTIDAVRVVHGEWKGYNADKEDWLRKDGTPIFLICNKCHGTVINNGSAHWNYCPNCGARMKGADDDDRCRNTDTL